MNADSEDLVSGSDDGERHSPVVEGSTCWICLSGPEEEQLQMGRCRCHGPISCVHPSCITTWVVEGRHKECQVCGAKYYIAVTETPPPNDRRACLSLYTDYALALLRRVGFPLLEMGKTVMLKYLLVGGLVRFRVYLPYSFKEFYQWISILYRWIVYSIPPERTDLKSGSFMDYIVGNEAIVLFESVFSLSGLFEALVCGCFISFLVHRTYRSWTIFYKPMQAEEMAKARQRRQLRILRCSEAHRWMLQLEYWKDRLVETVKGPDWLYPYDWIVACVWFIIGPVFTAVAYPAQFFILGDDPYPPVVLRVERIPPARHPTADEANLLGRRTARRHMQMRQAHEVGLSRTMVAVKGMQHAFLQLSVLRAVHFFVGTLLIGVALHSATSPYVDWHCRFLADSFSRVPPPPSITFVWQAVKSVRKGGPGEMVVVMGAAMLNSLLFLLSLKTYEVLAYVAIGGIFLGLVCTAVAKPLLSPLLPPGMLFSYTGFLEARAGNLCSVLDQKIMWHWVKNNVDRNQDPLLDLAWIRDTLWSAIPRELVRVWWRSCICYLAFVSLVGVCGFSHAALRCLPNDVLYRSPQPLSLWHPLNASALPLHTAPAHNWSLSQLHHLTGSLPKSLTPPLAAASEEERSVWWVYPLGLLQAVLSWGFALLFWIRQKVFSATLFVSRLGYLDYECLSYLMWGAASAWFGTFFTVYPWQFTIMKRLSYVFPSLLTVFLLPSSGRRSVCCSLIDRYRIDTWLSAAQLRASQAFRLLLPHADLPVAPPPVPHGLVIARVLNRGNNDRALIQEQLHYFRLNKKLRRTAFNQEILRRKILHGEFRAPGVSKKEARKPPRVRGRDRHPFRHLLRRCVYTAWYHTRTLLFTSSLVLFVLVFYAAPLMVVAGVFLDVAPSLFLLLPFSLWVYCVLLSLSASTRATFNTLAVLFQMFSAALLMVGSVVYVMVRLWNQEERLVKDITSVVSPPRRTVGPYSERRAARRAEKMRAEAQAREADDEEP